MMYSMWLRAALPGWPNITPQHLPISSIAITHCDETAVSFPLELGFLTWACSMKVRIWESGSACTPGSMPKTSSFLCKVKQIWLSNDNHMHGSLEGVEELVLSTAVYQSSCSSERLVESASVTCTQNTRTRAVVFRSQKRRGCAAVVEVAAHRRTENDLCYMISLTFCVVTSERLIRKTSQPFEVADKIHLTAKKWEEDEVICWGPQKHTCGRSKL